MMFVGPRKRRRRSSSSSALSPDSDEGMLQADSIMIESEKKTQEDSLDFSEPWQFSDVVLVVEEERLHVHRNILGMWSEVFTTMFTSEFKEKTAKEVSQRLRNQSIRTTMLFYLTLLKSTWWQSWPRNVKPSWCMAAKNPLGFHETHHSAPFSIV